MKRIFIIFNIKLYISYLKDIYHDYESVNNHVKSKYGVVLPESIKKYDISNGDDNGE